MAGGYDDEERAAIAAAFERARDAQDRLAGGRERLTRIDEHNTIRAPFVHDETFLTLARNSNIMALAAELLGGSHESGTFALNQQNGIVNPAHQDYNQGAFHRDLPYQHFASSRPLAINALYCVDAFTPDNGATMVVPGSHRMEPFPSDEGVRALSRQVSAPAGSFIVLDCMVFHSGASNVTDRDRRAVNHVYAMPMIRQQIDIPALLGERPDLDAATRRLLGYANPFVGSLEDYWTGREARL